MTQSMSKFTNGIIEIYLQSNVKANSLSLSLIYWEFRFCINNDLRLIISRLDEIYSGFIRILSNKDYIKLNVQIFNIAYRKCEMS